MGNVMEIEFEKAQVANTKSGALPPGVVQARLADIDRRDRGIRVI
jgi:uncharacterized lipoprotein YbaY